MKRSIIMIINKTKQFLGIELFVTSTAEKWVSVLGISLGIASVYGVSVIVSGPEMAMLLAPSMGAAALLVFVVPHARLSQPWAVFGGNLVAAIIGVSCYKLIPDPIIAAGLAVGLAVAVMHLLSCMHPPGGATALVAVVGGPTVHELGYNFVVFPILINVLVLLIVAIIFNSMFPWRRYPANLMRFTDTPDVSSRTSVPRVEKRFITSALEDMDMIIDVTSDDLQRLMTLVLEKAELQNFKPDQITLGHYYTNGEHGGDWSVRQIIDESVSAMPENDMVIYRTVEGSGLRSSDSCRRYDFARWAVREVFPNK